MLGAPSLWGVFLSLENPGPRWLLLLFVPGLAGRRGLSWSAGPPTARRLGWGLGRGLEFVKKKKRVTMFEPMRRHPGKRMRTGRAEKQRGESGLFRLRFRPRRSTTPPGRMRQRVRRRRDQCAVKIFSLRKSTGNYAPRIPYIRSDASFTRLL